MICKFSQSILARVFSVFALSSFLLTSQEPYFIRPALANDGQRLDADKRNDVSTIELTRSEPQAQFHGLEIAALDLNSSTKQTALVRCVRFDREEKTSRFTNVTRDCDGYSILTTDPLRISISYDLGSLEDEIDDNTIVILESGEQVAALDAMRPLSSHLDRTNSKTIATLQRQAGTYIAGAIKLVEQASAPAKLADQQALAGLQKVNPVGALNLVGSPVATPRGELALPYPIEFPGARKDFAPSVAVRYSSRGGYGPLGEGWKLDVPVISVETRWGTPLFDKDVETETYLLNGEQLIPETGSGYTGSPADALQLNPIPMRTTNLRPRKRGQARFVLRRDDELTRVIRHGDDPTNYWWEVWSEKPKSGHPRVMYFGNAPGRVPNTLKNPGENVPANQPSVSGWKTVVGEHRSAAIKSAQSEVEWNLAREVDNNGNVIDYDWASDLPAPAWLGNIPIASEKYLQRVLYTSTLATEETVLKCRELPASSGCRREWALYEVLFWWKAPDERYTRTNARSGGLLLNGRQLETIDVRARQLVTQEGDQPHLGRTLRWSCALPSVRYSFGYRREYSPSNDDTGLGRRFLERIVRKTGGGAAILKAKQTEATPCGWPDALGQHWANEFPTRFEYDLATSRKWQKTGEVKLANTGPIAQPSPFGLVSDVQSVLLGGSAGRGVGPLSANLLGSNFVSSASASTYLGINFFHSGKTNSFGVKSDHSKRTGYREATILLDVNSDGLNDLIFAAGGGYKAILGTIGANGEIGFETTDVDVQAPAGFVTFMREGGLIASKGSSSDITALPPSKGA